MIEPTRKAVGLLQIQRVFFCLSAYWPEQHLKCDQELYPRSSAFSRQQE